MQNHLLLAVEKHLDLGPVDTARVLGVCYSTYAAYKAGSRPLPRYHMLHCQAIGMLSLEARKVYIKGCLDGK